MSPAPQPLPEGARLTPLDPAFREDPYPILHELRRRAPVHRDGELNRVVLTRHDDVLRVLCDRDFHVDPHKSNPRAYHRLFMRDSAEERAPSMLMIGTCF